MIGHLVVGQLKSLNTNELSAPDDHCTSLTFPNIRSNYTETFLPKQYRRFENINALTTVGSISIKRQVQSNDRPRYVGMFGRVTGK